MTSRYSAPILALALLAAATSLAAADTVADSCNAIRDFVDYAFCANALRSGGGPGASTADRHAHLLTAADMAAARGASAGAAADAMARTERDPAARDGLEACGFLYGASSVPALRFLRGYAADRAWGRARPLLSLTVRAGIGCKAALEGAPEAEGRMAAANTEFDQLSAMATALLNVQQATLG
jgi:pectinesterase inhibitor-like protein